MEYMKDHEVPNVGTRDAARQLGVSFRDLYGLIDVGELPAYKVDRDIKLRHADSAAHEPAQEEPAHALGHERDSGCAAASAKSTTSSQRRRRRTPPLGQG